MKKLLIPLVVLILAILPPQTAYAVVQGSVRTVDPRRFGAKGDGVHDDTDAMRKTFRYAARLNVDRVRIKPGNYYIRNSLKGDFGRRTTGNTGTTTGKKK